MSYNHVYNCILSNLHYVTFAMCLICILLQLHYVLFALCYNCILSPFHFVTFTFCRVCILSAFDVLLHLHFVADSYKPLVKFFCQNFPTSLRKKEGHFTSLQGRLKLFFFNPSFIKLYLLDIVYQ